jgi:hypothetical protein
LELGAAWGAALQFQLQDDDATVQFEIRKSPRTFRWQRTAANTPAALYSAP